jgi:integrase
MVRRNPQDPSDRKLAPKQIRLVSGARVNRAFTKPLRALLRHAESHWDVPINSNRFPWKDWLFPEESRPGRELADTEEERLWSSIRPDYHPLLWFIANNGLRVGGALSMRKSRTNLERRETEVLRKTKKRGEHWARVKLTPAAVAVIATEMSKWKGDEIWTYEIQKGSRRGERAPIRYVAMRRVTDTIFRRAGLKRFRGHDLRHDFGSKLLRQTKNLKLVQEALHHSSIHVTAQFYAHVQDEELVAGRESVESSRKYTGILPAPAKKERKKLETSIK